MTYQPHSLAPDKPPDKHHPPNDGRIWITVQIHTQKPKHILAKDITTTMKTTIRKNKYKQQDDRLLKQLSPTERRVQERLRRQISSDILFQTV